MPDQVTVQTDVVVVAVVIIPAVALHAFGCRGKAPFQFRSVVGARMQSSEIVFPDQVPVKVETV